MAPKKAVFSVRVSEASEKAIDKLNAKEFRERFRIPMTNNSTRGSGSLCQPCSRNSSTSLRFPIFIHPNLVRVLMGCSIINMLYSLDLTLLELFFVYSLKKAKNDIFSVSAHLPSLQMVTELPDSTKGGAKGLVAVWGGWVGLSQHPSRPFSPNYTLKIPGLELRGHLVDWVEKASFACEYVINILPRKLAKDEIVPGEHYTVKELPLYQEAKEADAERRRKLLEDRDQKKTEGTIGRLPDRSGVRTLLRRKLQEKGEAGEEAWEGCEGTHSSQGVSSSTNYL
ncbi:hypothetical protein CK203_080519 [Vitis vinifera]|uniref:Uncharacterized protein n=1 Tax=Vitis vinifera TaxID=29760 RepID=A0A438E7D4_VITVI|nr:hypothetical protein CK203_080519 [Vitis vinifera]